MIYYALKMENVSVDSYTKINVRFFLNFFLKLKLNSSRRYLLNTGEFPPNLHFLDFTIKQCEFSCCISSTTAKHLRAAAKVQRWVCS